MKASTERKIIRWMHIVLSIPILGYIYGPLAGMPQQAMVVKWIIMPTVELVSYSVIQFVYFNLITYKLNN
jgi:hypothetical protein